jgi:nicotinate-nucleotide adenylyltransferase
MAPTLGVLGGAFNPPHNGHLALARAGLARGLDRVLMIPAGEPPHRRLERDPGAAVRLELTRLAVASLDGSEFAARIAVSPIEVDREGPSYTSRTLEALKASHPDHEMTLLLGADAAAGMESWHEPDLVLGLARIGVGARPGSDLSAVQRVFARLDAGDRLDLLMLEEHEISSSLVRQRIERGLPIDDLVPAPVAETIAERGLYL